MERVSRLCQKGLLKIIDTILPNRCALCRDYTQTPTYRIKEVARPSLCVTCWHQLSFITDPACHRCGAPLDFDGQGCLSCKERSFSFDRAYAALVYDDVSKPLFTGLKHVGSVEYAWLFGKWLNNLNVPLDTIDGIIPMPLHPKRLFERGYNQSTLIAKRYLHILKELNPHQILPPLLHDALYRTVHTMPQGHKSVMDRTENVKGVFEANPLRVRGKRLLLVDDVMTTGASLDQCAKTLKDADGIAVHVLVAGRAVRGRWS